MIIKNVYLNKIYIKTENDFEVFCRLSINVNDVKRFTSKSNEIFKKKLMIFDGKAFNL